MMGRGRSENEDENKRKGKSSCVPVTIGYPAMAAQEYLFKFKFKVYELDSVKIKSSPAGTVVKPGAGRTKASKLCSLRAASIPLVAPKSLSNAKASK